jgi:hypothetical protein
MLTTEDLEKIGIHDISTKFKKRLFYIDGINVEKVIPDYYDISDIYKMIFEIGFEKGVDVGKENKIEEFKKLFNIQ